MTLDAKHVAWETGANIAGTTVWFDSLAAIFGAGAACDTGKSVAREEAPQPPGSSIKQVKCG